MFNELNISEVQTISIMSHLYSLKTTQNIECNNHAAMY